MPAQHSTIRLDHTFTADEMMRIQTGVVPEEMEDKWFIYWKEGTLFFHRSWTGACIYEVFFETGGDVNRIRQAVINRDPDQYAETRDEEDARRVYYLIDMLLLKRDAVFPDDNQAEEDSALAEWSWIGRAMLRDEHKNDLDEGRGGRP